MRTAFARGNCQVNTDVVPQESCCGFHVRLGPDPNRYAAPEQVPIDASYAKMMRCKANLMIPDS